MSQVMDEDIAPVKESNRKEKLVMTSSLDTSSTGSFHHRPDGRTSALALRSLSVDIGCLHRADGSAKLSSGNTCVLAAVYGPASPRAIRQEDPEKAIIAVIFKHGLKQAANSTQSVVQSNNSSGGTGLLSTYGAKASELERIIATSLEACICLKEYPRTIIEIVLQVLQADGSVMSVAMNAAVVACMDAGIYMTSIPIGTTCLVTRSFSQRHDDEKEEQDTRHDHSVILLDPSSEEEQEKSQDSTPAASGRHLIRSNPSVVFLVTDASSKTLEESGNEKAKSSSYNNTGIYASFTAGSPMSSPDSFFQCVETSHKASRAVIEFIRMAYEHKLERETKTLWSGHSK